MALGHLLAEARQLLDLLAGVALGGPPREAAVLKPASDHQDRAEQHEQREQDVVQGDHQHQAEHQRPDGGDDAEPGSVGIGRSLGRAERPAGLGGARPRRAVERDRAVPASLAQRIDRHAGRQRRDCQRDVTGLEQLVGRELGLAFDPLSLDPSAIDRAQIGDRGAQATRSGRHLHVAPRHALIEQHEIAVVVAAHGHRSVPQPHSPPGVEPGHDPELQHARPPRVFAGRAGGGPQPGALVDADLAQREVGVAEASIHHDPGGAVDLAEPLGEVGALKGVEQVADGRVLVRDP